jgi:hypothetical protein
MKIRETLESEEFLILADDTFHIVHRHELEISLKPVHVFLTNRHIFVESPMEVFENRKLALSDIYGVSKIIINDLPVVSISLAGESDSLALFIPDALRRRAFKKLLGRRILRKTKSAGWMDRYCRQVRYFVIKAPSLQEFYERFLTNSWLRPRREAWSDRLPAATQKEIEKHLVPFAFFADFLETCPHVAFYCLTLIVFIMSLCLHYLSFGVFVSSAMFIALLLAGLSRMRGGRGITIRNVIDGPGRTVQGLLKANNKVLDTLNRRLLWGSAQSSLDVALFVLILLLLFLLIDPLILFFLGLAGMAFFERWDPFGFGSLSTFLSHLILW